MHDISVEIFNDDICSFSFLCCNRSVIKDNYDLFKKLTTDTARLALLEQLWFDNLKIKLTPSLGNWEKMNFETVEIN